MLGFFDKKKKILFVEDDENIMKMYKNYFAMTQKYSAVFASNRSEFLKYIDDVDAVVSDYHIPTLKFDEIKKRCEINKTPLVLISGDIQPYHKVQLGKPVTIKTIMTLVEEELRKASQGSQKKAA